MHLGIKVASRQESIINLQQTNATFAEVWYNANKPTDYQELFSYLRVHAPHSGLHFWGAIDDNIMATIAYPDTKILNNSISLIKRTIDTAAENNFSYVNIHPGTRALVGIDMATVTFAVQSKPNPVEVCEPLFLENAQILSTYAKNKGVLLTIESVPVKGDRKKLLDFGELPLSSLFKAVTNGIAFANDFGHTAANFVFATKGNTDQMNTMLYDVSKTYASRTKLLHIGFLAPPFQGADFHDQLDNPLLETSQTIPNYNQLINILKLYKNRDDMFALVEPTNDHVKNFFLAKTLLTKAGVLSL